MYAYTYTCIYICAYILTFSGNVSWKFRLQTSNLTAPKKKKTFARLKHNSMADTCPCMTVELLNDFFCFAGTGAAWLTYANVWL